MNIEELPLDPRIIRALTELGFTEPTLIQEKCIPLIKEGRDVVAQSQTGSGKTAAFGLPILEKLQPGNGIQVLILTPTRELCVQVCDAIRSYAKYLDTMRIASVYGGVSIDPQIIALKRADIVVATPGRVLDHMERRTISFANTRFVVLDEADKMLDMGFIDDVERIMRETPRERQTLLFSATLSDAIEGLIHKHLKDPAMVATTVYVDKSLLTQVYYDVLPHDKFSLLVHFLRQSPNDTVMIFCSTRQEVDVVASNLKANGIPAVALHGGHTQNKRQHALDSLKDEHSNILVATDVAARGIDVKNVAAVYNYDVPKTKDDYVHRIGRTARAGSMGRAITLLIQRDHDNFNNVLRDKTIEVQYEPLPERFPHIQLRRHLGEREGAVHGHRRGPPRHGDRRGPRRGHIGHGGHSGGMGHGGPRRHRGPRRHGGGQGHRSGSSHSP